MRNNHILQGLLFVVITTLIGVVAFVWSQFGDGDEAPAPEVSGTVQTSTDPTVSGGCTDVQIAINLEGLGGGRNGALEILSPLSDTDGFAQKIFLVSDGLACIPFSTMEQMLADAGTNVQRIDLELTYDPAGSISRIRSLLDYTPDYASDETAWSQPPSELKFGTSFWTSNSRTSELQVRWMTQAELQALVFPNDTGFAESNLHPTEVSYQNCLDNSGGVTVEMLNCAAAELEGQNAKLNAVYERKMRQSSEPTKSELRSLQREWITERDRRCDERAEVHEGGTLAAVEYNLCLISETTDRVDWLIKY